MKPSAHTVTLEVAGDYITVHTCREKGGRERGRVGEREGGGMRRRLAIKRV
jgi:hypothetical protein